MDIAQYPRLITSTSIWRLTREVHMFNPLPGNCWIGLHDTPENALEKYVLDSYDMYFKDDYPNVTGFEWWFHFIEKCDRMIAFHSDHDEMVRRENEGEMIYPLLSTVTYLNNHKSPTIVWDTSTGKNQKEYRNIPPTEVVFSIPEEGRMLTFNPRYIHGVLPHSEGRITLMYNLWDYRPKGLNRVDKRTWASDMSSHFFMKGESRAPTNWLGETVDTSVKLFGPNWMRHVTFKHPKDATNYGDFWSVIQ